MFRWLFSLGRNKTRQIENDLAQDQLVAGSRDLVIEAARSTADIASEVTHILKSKLDESLRQIEVTNRLIHDALLTCSPDGAITSTNRASDELFIDSTEYGFGSMVTNLFCGFEGNPEGLWEALARRERVRIKTSPISAQMVQASLARLTKYDGTPSILIIIHPTPARKD